ncbi:MAG: S1 family peptidase [Alphaproteobacteria bacterium]|nr:MAG: S1 family peptidase [Alphaproteobacteria bacterium]
MRIIRICLVFFVSAGLCVVAASGAMAGPAGSGESPLRMLSTADSSRGWEAVGKLELDGVGFCTATLIEEDVVLTAAHCLYDKSTGRRVEDERVAFLAGFRNGRAVAYRRARASYVDPEYVYDSPSRLARVAHDLAVIELDQPIRLPSLRPFATARLIPRDGEVGIVSYAQDREIAPSLQETCHILGRDPGVHVLSCIVDYGASGAPIFAQTSSGPQVVSVVSAKATWQSRPVALAAALEGRIDALVAGVRRAGRMFRDGRKRVRLLSKSEAMSQSGAKFVRP